MQIGAIILSGGKSSRMGTDKSMLQIKGKTLIQNAVDVCSPVCEPILISSNNPAHQSLNCRIVPDEFKNCGPMGGIYSGLKESKTDWNFILSVDAPFVETTFIQFLISNIQDSHAIVPFHANGKEPLIALYHKNSLPEIEKMLKSGNYKMQYLLDKLNTHYVNSQKWIEKYSDLFRNLNRLEDF